MILSRIGNAMADIRLLKNVIGDPPEETPPRKKSGRPKGSAKWPGSGRKPGGVNQSTKEIRAKIHRRGKPIEQVCDIANGKAEPIEGLSRGDAIRMLYRAVVPELRAEIVSGPDDGPIATVNFQADLERLATAFATPPEEQPQKLEGDALEAAKVVAFAKELAQRANGTAPPALESSTHETASPLVDTALEAEATQRPPEEPVQAIPEPPAEPTAPAPGERLRFLGADWYIEGHHGDRSGLPNIYELKGPGGLVRRASFDVCMDLLRKQLGDDLGEWQVEGARAPTDVLFEPSRPDQERSAAPRPQVISGWGNRRRTR